jgi:UDP-N-acetylglucosamine 2-epimerase (non-hydrolysing)
MKPGQDLFDITSGVLLGMRPILEEFQPHLVVVHGDTGTSTATALAAFYKQIPVAHIEAGLRTYNLQSPWPEELNRQLTGRIATWHFAPTQWAASNLLSEKVNSSQIVTTGNTVIDALQMARDIISTIEDVEQSILNNLGNLVPNIDSFKGKILLVTGHRRENFGDGFLNICHAIKELAGANEELIVIYPVHLNPNVQKPVKEILGNLPNVFLIPPQEYLPFVYLLQRSDIVLTDSGGIQEEAPGLGKPVLVMRDTTERPEALEAGTVKLVGTNRQNIVNEVQDLLNNTSAYSRMAKATNPYGDGHASIRIVEFLKSNL